MMILASVGVVGYFVREDGGAGGDCGRTQVRVKQMILTLFEGDSFGWLLDDVGGVVAVAGRWRRRLQPRPQPQR